MIRAISRFFPIAFVLLAGCPGGGDDPSTGGDTGGTMIVVQPSEPATLFPPNTKGTDEWVVVGAIFDRLAELGQDLNVTDDKAFTGRLATRWEWASDSLSIAFFLDPRIHWHDGAPLRAKDVLYTFRVNTSDSIVTENESKLSNIDSVSVRDSLTAVFWFKRRLPHQLFDATYHMYILPSHLLDTIPQKSLLASRFARAPIGTGRFRFTRWENQQLEITTDTSNARGRAKLDRVIWTFGVDAGAATVKLTAGQADFYEKILPQHLPEIAASKSFRLEPYPTLQYEFLLYNLHARGGNGPHPLFGDVNVRRALAMAVDRAGMARNVLDTMGGVALAPAPRVLIPDTAGLRQIPFDPAGARALLDSLGWIPNPKDGIRERNGVRFSFEVMAQMSSEVRRQLAKLLEQQFRAVGIEAKAVTLETKAMGPKVMGKDFDAFMWAWQMTPGRLGMAQTWRSDGEQNYGGYRSAEFDTMLDSAMTSMRTDLYKQRWTAVFQRLIDDQPGLWMAEARTPVAIHQRIHNVPLRGDGWQTGLADWFVDSAQRIDRDKIGLRSAR
jgi:peptide/nickel transport system substrate-binding protein